MDKVESKSRDNSGHAKAVWHTQQLQFKNQNRTRFPRHELMPTYEPLNFFFEPFVEVFLVLNDSPAFSKGRGVVGCEWEC